MFIIKSMAGDETVASQEALFERLKSMTNEHIAVHFKSASGIVQVKFVTVSESGRVRQSYGQQQALLPSDFA